MHVTLRQFEVFETVARLGSYTQAAESLHLSQPAVSMQVKKFEQGIGLPLFEQVGKKKSFSPRRVEKCIPTHR